MRGGNIFAQAKLVMGNFDDSSQTVTARLTHNNGAFELDRVDLFIDKQSQTCIYLCGWLFNVQYGDILDLRCGTYKGWAGSARMTAMRVDGLS
jgi:hypothetical protein